MTEKPIKRLRVVGWILVLAVVGALLSLAVHVQSQHEQRRLNNLLFSAVKRDDLVDVNRLLNLGASPNAREELDGSQKWFEELSAKIKALVHGKSKQPGLGTSVLYQACMSENEPVVLTALLKAGGDPNQVGGEQGDYPLHKAVYWGNINAIRSLMEHGADVFVKTKDGRPLLRYAVARYAWLRNDLSLVQKYSGEKKDIEIARNEILRLSGVLDYLVAHGANPYRVGIDGQSTMQWALVYQEPSIANELKQLATKYKMVPPSK